MARVCSLFFQTTFPVKLSPTPPIYKTIIGVEAIGIKPGTILSLQIQVILPDSIQVFYLRILSLKIHDKEKAGER